MIEPHRPLLEYNAWVRRRLVIALAFLAVALMGGTCEFRAVSHNPISEKPPEGESNEQETGLLVVVRTAGSDAITDDATLEPAIIETALAVSVLSSPSQSPTASADSAMPGLQPRPFLALSTVPTTSQQLANPIPEPGGFWLYGLGSILLSWRLRRPR